MDFAIKQVDIDSFKFLLDNFIKLQNAHYSCYMLDGWLLDAMRLDIDLKSLFESKLCTHNLSETPRAIDFCEQFEEFHSDDSTITAMFPSTTTEL